MSSWRFGLFVVLVALLLPLTVSIASAQPIVTGVNFLVTAPIDAATGESTITMATVKVGSLSDIITLAPGVASPYISLEPGTHTVTYTVDADGAETAASFDINLDIGISTVIKHVDVLTADTAPAVANQTSLRELLGLPESDMLAVVPGGFAYDYTAFVDGEDGEVVQGARLTKLPPGLDPGYTAFGIPDGTRSVVVELPEGDQDALDVPIVFIEGGTVLIRPEAGAFINYLTNKPVMGLLEYFNGRPETGLDTSHYLEMAAQTGFLPQLTSTDRHLFNVWVTSFLDRYPEGDPEYQAIFGDPVRAITTVSDSKTFPVYTAPWLEGHQPTVTWANGVPHWRFDGEDESAAPHVILSVVATGGNQVNVVNFLDRPALRESAGSQDIEAIEFSTRTSVNFALRFSNPD